MKALNSFLIATLLTISMNSAHAIIIKNNLGRTFDFRSIKDLIKLPKSELVANIEKQGIKILLSKTTDKPANPIFKNVPYTTAEEFEEVAIYSEYPSEEAEFINEYNPENYLKKNIIVISHDAKTLTLIHEYMHYLAYKQIPDSDKEVISNIPYHAGRSEVRMKDRFHRIMRNPLYMEKSGWRRDMRNAIDDFSAELSPAINYSFSEEIVIEKALREMVNPRSPYYDAERLELGEEYSKSILPTIAVKIRDINFLNLWFTDEVKTFDDEYLDEGELEQTLKQQAIVNQRLEKLVNDYNNLGRVLNP